jgi:hypothetical protein
MTPYNPTIANNRAAPAKTVINIMLNRCGAMAPDATSRIDRIAITGN